MSIYRAAFLALVALAVTYCGQHAALGSLVAHYRFDVEDNGTTPDAIGGNSATLGSAVTIDTTPGLARLGGGALNMTEANGSTAVSEGAVTNNSFSWFNDARTVTFWWRAKPVDHNPSGALVSFGTAGTGRRFDIRRHNDPGDLRLEIEGDGHTSSPSGFNDGQWHFVALSVPSNALLKDAAWYVDGGVNLNTSSSSDQIRTGTGPLNFGDSIHSGGVNRTPNGYLDDFQLYDRVLGGAERAYLFANPGATIAEIGPVLQTDFTGRTVNDNTAENITWQRHGLEDPGSLSAVDSGGNPVALFDTPTAQGHFAPDHNLEDDGPWSVEIPLTVSDDMQSLTLYSVELDWRHFTNQGGQQSGDAPVDWTVRLEDSSQNVLDSVTAWVGGLASGVDTIGFNELLVLTPGETYLLTLTAASAGERGNNTALNGLALNGLAVANPVPEPQTMVLAGIGLAGMLAFGRRRNRGTSRRRGDDAHC